MYEKKEADYHLLAPVRLEHQAQKELVRQRRACAEVEKELRSIREHGPEPVDEA